MKLEISLQFNSRNILKGMFLFPSSFSTHLSMKASNNRKCCEAENSECLLSTNQNALPSDDLTLTIELSVASTHSDCHKKCYRSKTFSKSHSKECQFLKEP